VETYGRDGVRRSPWPGRPGLLHLWGLRDGKGPTLPSGHCRGGASGRVLRVGNGEALTAGACHEEVHDAGGAVAHRILSWMDFRSRDHLPGPHRWREQVLPGVPSLNIACTVGSHFTRLRLQAWRWQTR
jgi:hypothetical protein